MRTSQWGIREVSTPDRRNSGTSSIGRMVYWNRRAINIYGTYRILGRWRFGVGKVVVGLSNRVYTEREVGELGTDSVPPTVLRYVSST